MTYGQARLMAELALIVTWIVVGCVWLAINWPA
jgi:hypothetical protein